MKINLIRNGETVVIGQVRTQDVLGAKEIAHVIDEADRRLKVNKFPDGGVTYMRGDVVGIEPGDELKVFGENEVVTVMVLLGGAFAVVSRKVRV